MKREFLKGLGIEGLTGEVIDQIMSEYGKSVAELKNESTTKEQKVNNLEEQLKEANKTIKGFKVMNVEDIQKAADDWKEKYETALKDNQAKIEDLEFQATLRDQMSELKFTSNAAKQQFIKDVEEKKLAREKGKILGFDDYVKQYGEKDPGVFVDEESSSTPRVDYSKPHTGEDAQSKSASKFMTDLIVGAQK